MTIHALPDGTIACEDACAIEDADKLQQYLLADPGAVVDWRMCSAAHTAVLQVLLACRPALLGPPRSDFLRIHIEPLMARRLA